MAVPAPRAQRRRDRARGRRRRRRGESIGWLGELHPLVADAWDLERTAAFAIDLGKLAARRPARSPPSRPFGAVPAAAPGHRGVAARRRAGRARCCTRVREAGGELLERRAACSTCTPASRWARAGARWRSRCPSARATARSPTRTWRRARADRRCARRAGRRAAWLSSAQRCGEQSGAAFARLAARDRRRRDRLRRARSRRTCCGAIRALSSSAVTGRSEVGRRLDDLYPRYRVPLEIEQLDLDAYGELDAAIVAYPHAAAAPTVGALRERGVRVVDLSADFRLRLAGDLRAVVRRAPAAGPARRGRLRADRASSRADRRRRASSPTRAATRPPRCSALAPLARAGLIADVVIDAKQGISGRRARVRRDHAPVDGGREHPALQGRRTPPHARDRGAARAVARARGSRSAAVQFQAHLVPLDQGELADCYVTPTRPVDDAELAELFAAAYARRAVRRGASTRRRARATCRRPTSAACSPRPTRTPARCSCSRRSTTSGRAPPRRRVQNLNVMFGLPETEGLRERAAPGDGRRPAAAVLPLALGAAPEHVRELAPDAGLPAGFRAAGVACGIKPSGDPDLGPAGVRRRDARQRGALHRQRHARRAGARHAASAAGSQALRAVLANSGCANAATGGRGLDDAAKTQGAAALARRRASRPRWRSPRPARSATTCRSSDAEGHPRGRAAAARATATATSSRRSRRPTRFEKRANLEVALPSGDGAAVGAVQGRRA